MNISKPNDILVATLNNPQLTPYDLLSNNINGENTSLFEKEDYKKSDYIQAAFKGEDGKFDEVSFDQAYNLARNNFQLLTNQEYIESLDTIKYSPFDLTRPKFANTFSVNASFETEINPFEEKRGWTGIGSVDASPLSVRELAQRSKIYDPETKTWSEKSLNDLNLLDKYFGDTLVYAQYDEEGEHIDLATGLMVKHKAGDWKINKEGHLFTEKLNGREIYGRQVVNPSDLLTTDGSIINKFDFLDSDGREKSLVGTAFKIATEIAPFLIPGMGALKGAYSIPALYGGIKAAIGLTTAMPSLYKSLEGLLAGEDGTSLTKGATEWEGWLAKFGQTSTSDAGTTSLFNVEQMAGMVSGIFSQIFEQRAAASLAKLVYRGDSLMTAKTQKLANDINQKLIQSALEGKIKFDDIGKLSQAAMEKIPALQSVIKSQSQLSKAFSLGYMAIISTSDIYGEAIKGGFDRRTAGFAALAAATGQYGVMMNNKMGYWFLDKTTGYSEETNRALVRKGIMPWLKEVEKGFKKVAVNAKEGKKELSTVFGRMKNSLVDIFTTPSVIGEAMWKNALIEGIEELTEQVVLDATKGVVDVMSYLGLTKKKGTFGGFQNVFSKEGFENYLANFVGGIIGGGLFEFHRSKIAPWTDSSILSPDTQKNLYELVAAGHKDELIDIVNKYKKQMGNQYITPSDADGNFKQATDGNISQADLIAGKAIDMINLVDGILNSHDYIQSDEEVVNKAIRDKIIIDHLNTTKPANSEIGLEGLVLDDYKKGISEVTRIESQIKNLTESPEDLEIKKRLKEELKIHVDNVNSISDGTKGSEYFTKAEMYLNKAIHGPFMKINKTDFVKETYGKDYESLPADGLGLTKERIDKEWEEYVNGKNLKKDLDIMYRVYTKLEQQLNKPVEKYTTTGYDIARKEALQNILDLKATINLFNTSTDPKAKEAAFNHFIEVNNTLGLNGIIAPWTALNNDMFEQLDTLGLIKKMDYVEGEDGRLLPDLTDFSPEELSEIVGENTTRKDKIKEVINSHFKLFPMNPLNAEVIIESLNRAITGHNTKVFAQIKEIEEKENQTPEDETEINNLRGTLLNFSIGPLNSTPEVKELSDKSEIEIANLLAQKNITIEQIEDYNRAEQEGLLYSESYNDILDEYNIKSPLDLDKDEVENFLQSLSANGLFQMASARMEEISENFEEALSTKLLELKEDTVTEETYNEFKEFIEPFFSLVESMVRANEQILNNEDVKNVTIEYNKILQNLETSIEQAKPDIFKLHNYALDLLTQALESGTADKEVFLEAEKLANEELRRIAANTFPNGENLPYEQLLRLVETSKLVIENVLEEFASVDAGIGGDFTDMTTLSSIIAVEEARFQEDSKYTGVFENIEMLTFVKNHYDSMLSIDALQASFKNSLESFKLENSNLKRVEKFLKVASSGIKLKSNSLYDFIKDFVLTLDSNPNNKSIRIFNLLEEEEKTLKSASSVTNYISDNIKVQDLQQAVNQLEMIKAVVFGMSTTEVDFADPYGFIQSRINYAKKYDPENEVLKLKTITSDLAALLSQDLDVLISKLNFLSGLSMFNQGKVMNEEEDKRTRVQDILLGNWNLAINKVNPSFLPLEKLREILSSTSSNAAKLLAIENAVFDHNITQKSDALEGFLNQLSFVDSDVFSQIDKDVKTLESWDLAVYYATVLATRASDFETRIFNTIKGEFKKAPFYTQELDARIIKGSTVDPELYASIFKTKANSAKAKADFITIVLGGAGTGKTTAVFGLAMDNLRQTNESSTVWLAAPTEVQRDNLVKGFLESVGESKIDSEKFSKVELFKRLGIFDLVQQINAQIKIIADPKGVIDSDPLVRLTTDEDPGGEGNVVFTDVILNNEWLQKLSENMKALPNLLLIDEVTHFSSFELYLLNAISRHSFVTSDLNFMKIVGAGDPTQLGHLVQIGDSYYSYNVDAVNAIFTPRLWTSVRVSNSQKRLNNDRYIRITREIESIYKKHDGNYSKASAESLTYLQNNLELNTLAYHLTSSNFAGDMIVPSLNKELVTLLANKLADNTKTIGILTKDHEIPEDWNQLLTEAGIINAGDKSRVKIFTPEDVQGSEVDYFIFDAEAITKFDKTRDNLKAFYTFMSRSKTGSIIVDPTKILEKYHIFNGKNDATTVSFELMTNEVITEAKNRRAAALTALLGENPIPSDNDNFKWKIGEGEVIAEPIEESRFVTSIGDSDSVYPNSTKDSDEADEDAELREDFKVMMHTFYNNPNAVIEADGTIKVDPDGTSTDLNFSSDVDKSKSEKVIREWGNLKSHLLHNKGKISTVLSSDYKAFFEHAFKGDVDTTQIIGFETVMTVSPYNKITNKAFKKYGFDESLTLESGNLFINLSAKLTLGSKVHYVTLATFGTEDKIKKQADKYKNISIDSIDRRFRYLEKKLSESPNKFLVYKLDNLDSFDFFTRTRLVKIIKDKKRVTHTLQSLQSEFPGMQFSEIRFFPQELSQFKGLLKKYTFGPERFSTLGLTPKEVDRQFSIMMNGLREGDKPNGKYIKGKKLPNGVVIEDSSGTEIHGLKNKPYIVATTANDRNGNIGSNRTQATLIPIGAQKRDLKTLTREVEKLLDERKDQIILGKDSKQKAKPSDLINAKTETLLNRHDILRVLIHWVKTPTPSGGQLIDLLTKEISFSISDKVSGNTTSVFKIFTRMKNVEKNTISTEERLMEVIDKIKKVVRDKPGATVSEIQFEVIPLLKNITAWHWSFFNIFAYEKIIDEAANQEFFNLAIHNEIDDIAFETFNNSEGAKEMSRILGILMKSIEKEMFYYSIPITAAKPVGTEFRANSFISGINGFSPETYGDKFYINVTPEGPRMLMDVDTFLSATEIDDNTTPVTPITVVTPPPPPTPAPKPVKKKAKKTARPTSPAVQFDPNLATNLRADANLQTDLELLSGLDSAFGEVSMPKNRTATDLVNELGNFLNTNLGWGITDIDYISENKIIKFISGEQTFSMEINIDSTAEDLIFLTTTLENIVNAKYDSLEPVLDNENLIVKMLGKFSEDEDGEQIKVILKPLLEILSNHLGDNLHLSLTDLISSDGFNTAASKKKVEYILTALKLKPKSTFASIAEVEAALNIAAKTERNLVKSIKTSIDNLLKLCK